MRFKEKPTVATSGHGMRIESISMGKSGFKISGVEKRKKKKRSKSKSRIKSKDVPSLEKFLRKQEWDKYLEPLRRHGIETLSDLAKINPLENIPEVPRLARKLMKTIATKKVEKL